MRRKRAAVVLSTVLLVAAGCGDDDGGGGGGDGDNAVTVGLIPIVDVAPLFLGDNQGFFADRGIELDTEFAAGGADIVPGVQSGQFDFGFSNIISMMLVHSVSGDIQVVSNGNNSTGVQGEDFGSLMVPADSEIESAAELSGGPLVAINTLSNIADTVVRASVLEAGGDPNDIELTPVAFPDMPEALASGEVDAAFVVEPFQTISRSEGARSIASSWVDGAPEMTVAVYFTSTDLAESDPDLVQRFTEAIQESLAYANDNPEAVREVLPEYTSLTPELAAEITLPTWPAEINRESVETIAQLALDYGDPPVLSEEPDLDALLP